MLLSFLVIVKIDFNKVDLTLEQDSFKLLKSLAAVEKPFKIVMKSSIFLLLYVSCSYIIALASGWFFIVALIGVHP